MPRKSNSRPDRRAQKRHRALERRLRIAERQAAEYREIGPLLGPSLKLGHLPLHFVTQVIEEQGLGDDLDRQGLDHGRWV